MIKRLFFKLTGGRPMRHVPSQFMDFDGNKIRELYVDGNGRTWMAEGPWSWKRVGINPTVD